METWTETWCKTFEADGRLARTHAEKEGNNGFGDRHARTQRARTVIYNLFLLLFTCYILLLLCCCIDAAAGTPADTHSSQPILF